uniref:Uncharacterized protein n=1 Tax=virus sp. ctBM815 TaxID=2825806 RepID=A0A8S5RKD9_9VIRU|nr:MAG TPA: hypothetical protein [virus sp. ctBM815]
MRQSYRRPRMMLLMNARNLRLARPLRTKRLARSNEVR